MLTLLMALSAHANEHVKTVSFLFSIMKHCYEVDNKVGIELGQCMMGVLSKHNNPQQYRVNIDDDNPGKNVASHFKITVYNKNGLVVSCTGIAQEKIDIKQCTDEKVPPLTPVENVPPTSPDGA